MDFVHVADEIAAGEAYGNMARCGGPFGERSRPTCSMPRAMKADSTGKLSTELDRKLKA